MHIDPGIRVLTRLLLPREGWLATRLRALRVIVWRPVRLFVRTEDLALFGLAILVGVLTGVSVSAIKATVQRLHELLFGLAPGESLSATSSVPALHVLLAPALGGLAVGLYTWSVRQIRRREVIDPIEANALYGGRMGLVDSALLTLGTVLSSGCGASVGLEAGYTQFGSGAASKLGRSFHLRRGDLRMLVGCGAAGAIAAAFNAPLAGAFYAFELVIGAYTVASLAPVVVAALVATVIDRHLAGASGLDIAATFHVANGDYALFALLGLCAGGLGILMMQMATAIELGLKRARVPPILRPGLGGLGVGLLALYSPAVLGAGHGASHDFLRDGQALAPLAILLVAKLVAAALSVGSGFRGGLFYTSLFVGVLVGNLGSGLVSALAPELGGDRIVYALVGMAALAAAVIGAPMTMILLVLEETGDLAVAGAVATAVVIASVLVRRAFGYSFATWRLHLRGETIRSALDIGWARDLTVVKLMRREARTASDQMTIAAFRKRFPVGAIERVFLTDEAGRYAGLVVVAEAHAPECDETAETTLVRALARAPQSFLLPRQTIERVLEAFEAAEIEALPVVDDPAARRVLGYVSEAHALKRYAQELERRRREYSGERE